MGIATELFPSRVGKRVVSAVPAEKQTGIAKGDWNPKKKEAVVPVGENAYDRTIRLNEALHAIYYPVRDQRSYLGQALENAKLHMKLAKTEGAPRRDEIYTAFKDLRFIKDKMQSPAYQAASPDNEYLAKLKVGFMRAAAMLHRGCESETTQRRADKLLSEVRELFKKSKGGSSFPNKADEAMDAIDAGDMNKALIKLEGELPANRGGTPLRAVKEGSAGGSSSFGASWFKLDGDGKPMGGEITTADIEGLSKASRNEIENAIKENTMPEMAVVPLSLSESVQSFKGKGEKLVMAGSKIRAKRLAMVVAPQPPRIFVRKMRREGGTILIDASGSMGLTPQKLREICGKIPLGTIAYYSGYNDSVGGRYQGHAEDGHLVIFAQNGRRSTCEDLPHKHGGNYVDLNAIMWLLKQPGPRYFVCDGGYTGPVPHAAREMATNAIAKGQITQIHSIDQLEKFLPELGRKD